MYQALHILPLVAALSNILLGIFILSKNPKEKLNRLYALVAFAVGVWSACDLFYFSANSAQNALLWDKVGTLGTCLTVSFLLHFFLVFTKKRIHLLAYVPLYVFPLLVAFLDLKTNLISVAAVPVLWGYTIQTGIYYVPFTLFLTAYSVSALILCLRYYITSTNATEKIQSKYILIAVSIPQIAAIATEILPSAIGFKTFPLASMLSTITDVIIAYTMIKYGLMTITAETAAQEIIETMTDFLIVINNEKSIILVNHSCLDALGYSKEELIGKNINTIIPKESTLLDAIGDSSCLKNYQTQIMTNTGTLLSVSVNCSPMSNKLRGTFGFILLMRDLKDIQQLIDDLKTKTHALEESKIKLEKNVSELERINKLMVDRELKMVELKNEIEQLKNK